jgi:hypothetical protein
MSQGEASPPAVYLCRQTGHAQASVLFWSLATTICFMKQEVHRVCPQERMVFPVFPRGSRQMGQSSASMQTSACLGCFAMESIALLSVAALSPFSHSAMLLNHCLQVCLKVILHGSLHGSLHGGCRGRSPLPRTRSPVVTRLATYAALTNGSRSRGRNSWPAATGIHHI